MCFCLDGLSAELKTSLSQFDFCKESPNGIKVFAQNGNNQLIVSENGQSLTVYYRKKCDFVYLLFLYSLSKKSVSLKNDFEDFTAMVDLSRNAVRTVDTLKKFMQILVLSGYKSMQLYMEDTYLVEDEPFFGYQRGAYSTKELQEIVNYGELIGLECLPAIQTLAHLNRLLHWPKFHSFTDANQDILLVDDERTYELIEKMFRSLRKSFTSDRINIGMDEAHFIGLGRYLSLHGYCDRSSILVRHLNRVCEIANKYGFTKPMMWGDMFLRLANGGDYEKGTKIPEHIKNLVPENVTLVNWNYYSTNPAFYENIMTLQKKFDRDCAYASGASCWFEFTPNNQFAIKQNTIVMNACKKTGVKKYIYTLWGDDGAECSLFASLPATIYCGCVSNGVKNYKKVFKAITGVSFDKFMLLDEINNTAEKYGDISNPNKYMLFNDLLIGLLDSTVKLEDGVKYKDLSKKLHSASKTVGEWNYIFKTQKALSDVLSIKYNLGVELRSAYKANDKENLKTIANSTINKLIKLIKIFYREFASQWMKENKSFGFEVQDIRFGGLILRLEHVSQIINDYLNGKIPSILELETQLLNVACLPEETNGKSLNFAGYCNMITANVSFS